LDIQTMAVEYTSVLSEIRKASEVLQAGKLEELTVCTESLTLILRVITDEYFIAVVLSSNGNYGKGRYLIRMAAPKLVEEF
ncbi:MAG: roadblock/LC7 domain-containing protein, partial [Proteobacteria bacterium]|nr:roadblock/LC7 domain-containing protein [Pseudomonadota bacterium]